MIKHIVFFKLDSGPSSEEKKDLMRKMEEIFAPLGQKLSFIEEYRTGINFNTADHAWDFTIDSVFRNREDLEQYQKSTEHIEAVRLASSIGKKKAVIDYEF
jgi:hypothetical protein